MGLGRRKMLKRGSYVVYSIAINGVKKDYSRMDVPLPDISGAMSASISLVRIKRSA